MSKDEFVFEGFEPANTTPVPDVLFDELLSELSESELKVLLYIIRRTAGFKKPTDAISLTQFQKGIKKRATGEILDRGCGVKDRATIIKALASLEKKQCIQSTKANDPSGDKATSSYRILFRSEVVGKTNHPVPLGSGQNQPPWFENPTTVVGNSNYGVVGDSNLQETVIQETDSQETVIQKEGEPPASLINFTEEKKKRTDPGMPVVQVTTDTVSHSYRQSTLGNGGTYVDSSRRGYDVQDHPGNTPDWPDSHTGNPTHSRQGQVALQVDEDEDDTPTEKVPVVKPSRQPLGAVLTEEQLDEAYDAYIAPSKQPAPGLRITQAPTSKAVTQATLPEPKGMTDKQRGQAEKTGLERRIAEIYTLYGEEIGRKPTHSKANDAGALLLIKDEISDADIRTTIRAILADSFMAKNLTLSYVHTKVDAFAQKSAPAPHNGKAAQNGDEPELGVSGLPKLKARKMNYA